MEARTTGSAVPEAAGGGERRGEDRRQLTWRSLLHYFYRNRRRRARRTKDREHGYYVDTHEAGMLVLIVSILLLCITDAYVTLWLIDHGGQELNPIMDFMIAQSPLAFFSVKFTVTAGCLVFLLMHRHFRLFVLIRGWHLLYSSLAVYIALIGYEITLVLQVTATT